jgi:hypothetical protein
VRGIRRLDVRDELGNIVITRFTDMDHVAIPGAVALVPIVCLVIVGARMVRWAGGTSSLART